MSANPHQLNKRFPKLRILVCSDPGIVHTQRLIECLNKRAKVGLFWYGEKGSTSKYQVSRYPLFIKSDKNFPKFQRKLRKFAFYSTIKIFKPTIIHIHREAWWCNTFHKIAPNIPIIFTSWGHIPDHMLHGKWGKNIQYAAGLTADAPTLIDELKSIDGCGTIPATIFRFGVSESTFCPAPNYTELKRELSIPLESKIVFSPRSLRAIYNHTTLIKSIPKIIERIPNTYFLFVNNHGHRYKDAEEYKSILFNLGNELGVNSNIRFLEHLVDHSMVAKRYQSADVVVSIPLKDGFPATIFEAMACGVPLIVSDLPDYKGVINNQNAILINPRQEDELTEAIIKVLTNPKFKQNLVKEGLLTYRKQGTMSGEVDKLIAFYKQLTG